MVISCKTKNVAEEGDNIVVPEFSADSAYQSIETQCAFGPRILASEAHNQCGEYIINSFKQYGCEVQKQEATFTLYDGTQQEGYNIIARTKPNLSKRILICTHWDSRPWADNDADESNWHTPVLAANDGASGVGVMIEIARILQDADTIGVGIDFICFDAEDVGVPDWDEDNYDGDTELTWCLGSQYWASNPHDRNFMFGILLDMVGSQGAIFHKEGYSVRYASWVVDKVWDAANKAGYQSQFSNSSGGYITDDHLPINQITRIPTINIIPYYTSGMSGFCPTWHTLNDTPQNIDKQTLKAVGQTLLQLIYEIKTSEN